MTPAPSDSRLAGSRIKGLNCPNCGAALTIRGFEHTLTVVCPQCLSVLDAKDPNLQILQKFESKTRIQPLIPLGTRGNWRGVVYEVIGFQLRTVTSGGVDYSWSESLLCNPYKGFRYLTEYHGHWNDLRALRALPESNATRSGLRIRPNVTYDHIAFSHFSTAQVRTTYVLGEFPWQVQRGETCAGRDFIAPPKILSCEETPAERVWSIGVYVSGAEVWQSFKLAGAPPRPVGVYLNQPSMLALASRELWTWCGIFVLLALTVMMLGYMFSGNQQVFQDSYQFKSGAREEASFVTPVFELKGRTSNVEVSTQTNLSNNWTYFNYALIDADSGRAFDFGRELSYYSGRDSDGAWSEGTRSDTATLPGIGAGHYYLRVEPEMAAGAEAVRYEITVRRDVPLMSWFWLTAFLLLIPPVYTSFRRLSFERQRWMESDYPPVTTTSGGDDD